MEVSLKFIVDTFDWFLFLFLVFLTLLSNTLAILGDYFFFVEEDGEPEQIRRGTFELYILNIASFIFLLFIDQTHQRSSSFGVRMFIYCIQKNS